MLFFRGLPVSRRLSRREKELKAFLFTSATQKSIAHTMGITHGSVKMYCQRLYSKLGITSRIEMMAAEILRLSALQCPTIR